MVVERHYGPRDFVDSSFLSRRAAKIACHNNALWQDFGSAIGYQRMRLWVDLLALSRDFGSSTAFTDILSSSQCSTAAVIGETLMPYQSPANVSLSSIMATPMYSLISTPRTGSYYTGELLCTQLSVFCSFE